ncbi:MAG TPA: NAD(P)H-dependent oxidoreductase [Terriglobia bacterium]|nr:NAD(P)H-dependent oxidoreductase [Terriglobia bacterium]
MKLLRIDSSARRSSISRDLTAKFTEAWKKEHTEGEVVERDLATTSLPLVTDEWTQAAYTNPSKRTPAQQQALSVSDALIDELVSADTIVIGVPMYNFTIPSSLKAWIDQVVRVGRTVKYGANGPQGLISGKKVVIIMSRGGAYSEGTPRARMDFQEPYLRHILGFIGLTDVTFIHVENQLSDLAELSRAAALGQIEQVVTQSTAAV